MALPGHPLEINLDPMTLSVGDQKALMGKYDPFRFTDLMLKHSNLTEAEIDAILPGEMSEVFDQINAALGKRAVPKVTGRPSKRGRKARQPRPSGSPALSTANNSESSPIS
jgi:hypothetical protein